MQGRPEEEDPPGNIEMYCNSCGSPNPDSARYCSSCGDPVQSPAPNLGPRYELKPSPDVTLIRATLIAQDEEHRLWSAEDVRAIREWLLKHHKRVPTFQTLYASFGKEVVDAEVQGLLEERTKYLA